MAKKKTLSSAPDQSSKSESPEPLKPPVDFETSLGEIEQIVRDLEAGSLTLDESLKQYEHAVGKMRQCYQLLEVAERKISVLAGFDADGIPITRPIDDSEPIGSQASDNLDSAALVQKQKNRGRRRGAGSSSVPDSSINEGESFQ